MLNFYNFYSILFYLTFNFYFSSIISFIYLLFYYLELLSGHRWKKIFFSLLTLMKVWHNSYGSILNFGKISSKKQQRKQCIFSALNVLVYACSGRVLFHHTVERERWNRCCFLLHLMKVRQVVQYQISRKKLAIFIFPVNFNCSIWFNDIPRKE